MSRSGRLHEWYRFLDAHSDEDAASSLSRDCARLGDVYADIVWELQRLAGSPGEVEEVLRVARGAVGEALDMLGHIATRFRAGEREVS